MYIVFFVKVNIGYLKLNENVYTSLQGESCSPRRILLSEKLSKGPKHGSISVTINI